MVDTKVLIVKSLDYEVFLQDLKNNLNAFRLQHKTVTSVIKEEVKSKVQGFHEATQYKANIYYLD